MTPKLLILIVIPILAALPSLAARLPLEKVGMSEPFYVKDLNVVWNAPTNRLPSSVRVFKVVPTKYSAAVVSNLMALGGFTERDRVKAFVPGNPLPKDSFGFFKEDEKRTLSVFPKHGFIEYRDEKATAAMYPRQPVEGLPDDQESVRLALAILSGFEIDTSHLAVNPDGTARFSIGPGSRGYFDKTKGKYVKEDHLRRVSFTRRLEGFDVIGGRRQGIDITFGNHGRISRLEVDWRHVEPLGSFPFVSIEQLVTWICEGRARVQSFSTTGARWLKTSDVKRLRVLEITLQYFAGMSGEPLDQMHPYALLKAEAELGADDKETIWLFCPVIAEGLNRPARRSEGFSLYPSALYEKLAQTRATAD